MEEKTKINTKEYYICGTCKEKMDSISLGKGGDLFDFGMSSAKAMYCVKKECDKFGYLTLVGIKVAE